MQQTLKNFLKHTGQHCGAERKLVETLIDDEFFWDATTKSYVPNGYTDDFEHRDNKIINLMS